MDIYSRLALFSPLDALALAALLGGWFGIGLLIERAVNTRPSVSHLMKEYRRDWMKQFLTRDPRIFDASIVASLRQGTAFFASATMIGIGGGLALIGNAERVAGVASDLSLDQAPAAVWELKLIVAIAIVAAGFLKFVWANRLFGYCSVLMAAVPNDISEPDAGPRAGQAAEICILASEHFNRGLRAVYFALAALAWLLGPLALITATAVTLWVLGRREFASRSRNILIGETR